MFHWKNISLFRFHIHTGSCRAVKLVYLETGSDKSISSNSLCDLSSIIFKNNYFETGTKFAFPYSNLFMTGLEKILSQNSEFEPFLWLRYLDEIFCIWTQGFHELKEFSNCISSLHTTIKFTMDYSATEINFLGVIVTNVRNRFILQTKQYSPVPSCTISSP